MCGSHHKRNFATSPHEQPAGATSCGSSARSKLAGAIRLRYEHHRRQSLSLKVLVDCRCVLKKKEPCDWQAPVKAADFGRRRRMPCSAVCRGLCLHECRRCLISFDAGRRVSTGPFAEVAAQGAVLQRRFGSLVPNTSSMKAKQLA